MTSRKGRQMMGRPRFSAQIDGYIGMLILRHIDDDDPITQAICRAVCRGWRSLLMRPKGQQRRPAYMVAIEHYVATRPDDEMACLAMWMPHSYPRFPCWPQQAAIRAAIRRDKPKALSLLLAHTTADLVLHDLLDLAVCSNGQRVLASVLIPATLLSYGGRGTLFRLMMTKAPVALFEWYGTNFFHCRYVPPDFDLSGGTPVDLEEKLTWMAKSGGWTREFWEKWFADAAWLHEDYTGQASNGTRIQRAQRRNVNVAIAIVAYVWGKVPQSACTFLRKKHLRHHDENLALHERLRPWCECEPEPAKFQRVSESAGPQKRARTQKDDK
jgi:hypothetical protein